MPSETQSTGRRIVRAMFVVLFFYVFWKFGGFLLNACIGSIFGSGDESDAYFLAYNSVIFMVYGIVLKFFMPAFVPLFMETMENEGEEPAWRFASGTINALVVALVVVAGLGMVFAPKIMWIVGPGYFRDPADPRGPMTILWVRIMFPGLVGMCVGIFTYGLLNSYKIFSYPAAGDACQKLLWAMALFLMVAVLGRRGVAIPIGFLVGVVGQLTVNLMGLRSRLHFYRPLQRVVSLRRIGLELAILAAFALACFAFVQGVPGLRSNSKILILVIVAFAAAHLLFFWLRARRKTSLIGRFAALAAPLLIGILVAKARDVLTDNFTTEAALPGLLSDKKYAEKVGQLPSVVVGYALAIAMLPYLCDMAAKKSMAALGEVVDRAWRMMALFFIPLSVVTAALAQGVMQLVYDRGSFPEEHLVYGGIALSIYISGLFFYAVENVLMYSFFSLQRTWIPTIAGFVASLFHVAFLFVCDYVFTLTGPKAGPEATMTLFYVAILSFPLSRGFKNVLLFALLRFQIPMLRLIPTATFVVKIAVISVVIWFTTRWSGAAMTKVLDPNKMKGREVVVDLFEDDAAADNWRPGANTTIRVENVANAAEKPERALRIDGPLDVQRRLGDLDLSRTDVLQFKVKSGRDCTLTVYLTFGRKEAKAAADVKASKDRRRTAIPLDAFDFDGETRPEDFAGADRLRIASEDVGPVWLDTVVFTKTFPRLHQVVFEMAKMVVVGVPALVGLIVLIVGAFVLRIEELGLVLRWLREQGMDQIKKRLKGKGRDVATQNTPDS